MSVIINTPSNSKNSPPTKDMPLKYPESFERCSDAHPMASAVKRKGTARPRENTTNNKAPDPRVAEEAAKESRTGARALRTIFTAIINAHEFDPSSSGSLQKREDGGWRLSISADMVRKSLRR